MSIHDSDMAIVQAIDWLEQNGLSLDAIAAAQKANPDHFRAALDQIAHSASEVDRHTQVLGETWSSIIQLTSGVA